MARMEATLLLAITLSTLGTLSVVARATDAVQTRADITPLPPIWPSSFKVEFDEETYITWWTFRTSGLFYYDAVRNMSRVDRENGIGDRYCGSAYPLRNTPCTHLVRDNMRFLIFPEYKYCCKCCSDSNGCGILRQDWLGNATFEGRDVIYGITCNKWNKAGLQNNYYWQAEDQTPMRITMEFTEQMTFRHNTYQPHINAGDQTFEYPTDMDCSLNCYGVCAIAAPNDGAPPASLRGAPRPPVIRQVV